MHHRNTLASAGFLCAWTLCSWPIAANAQPAAAASGPLSASYKALLIRYEQGVLDGGELIEDEATSVLASFFGLAPPYARLLYRRTCGMPFPWQLEELFPGHRLNRFMTAEYGRRIKAMLSKMNVTPHLMALVAVAKQHNIRLLAYTTLDNERVMEDIKRRKLPIQLAPMVDGMAPTFPPLEYIRKELEISQLEMVLVGSTAHECTTAGLNGIDFVSLIPYEFEPLESKAPCLIKWRIRSLQNLTRLLR